MGFCFYISFHNTGGFNWQWSASGGSGVAGGVMGSDKHAVSWSSWYNQIQRRHSNGYRNDLPCSGTTSESLHNWKQGSVMGTTVGDERKTLGCWTEYVNVINHPETIIRFVSGAWGLVLSWVFISYREKPQVKILVQTAVFIIQTFRIIIHHISGSTVWSCTGWSGNNSKQKKKKIYYETALVVIHVTAKYKPCRVSAVQ